MEYPTSEGRASSNLKRGDWAVIHNDRIICLFDSSEQANDWMDANTDNEHWELAYISWLDIPPEMGPGQIQCQWSLLVYNYTTKKRDT